MLDSIFDRSIVNKGRQKEIDLLKAFSIIMMIITHVVDDLYINYDEHLPSAIINDVLAQTIGAAGFMICMGIGIMYSKGASPKEYFRRGLSLLIVGQVLNLIRYGLVGITAYAISGEELSRDYVMLVFSNDILQFAGLFFIFMGLAGKLDLKPIHVFIISVVFNLIATFFAFKIKTGAYALDQFIGMFIATESESYFPMFNWMIYPAFGMVLGQVLLHVKDKKKFYGILLVPTAVIWGVYYYIGVFADQHVIKFYNEWRSIAYVNIVDAGCQLICNFSMLCMFYFLTLIMTEKIMKGVYFVSHNINRYYCVHLVFVHAISALFPVFFGENPIDSALKCYLTALGVLILCTIIIWYYDLKMFAPLHKALDRHIYFWYALVVILSIAACVFASLGGDTYPNLYNDYMEGM